MTKPETPFGRQFRQKYFDNFDDEVHNLNHGAFGAAPTAIMNKKFDALRKVASFPDKFFMYDVYTTNKESRDAVAPIMNCDPNDIVFCSNATSAVNAVLRSYPFARGDVIICFATIFGSCLNTLKFLEKHVGIKYIKVDYEYPISNKEILDKFQKVVDECEVVPKMAFFDGVSSVPSPKFPWEEMTKLCSKLNILSFVDAAHYIGLLPIDLAENQPDFFVSNVHKWLFVPNACAVLYVNPKHQKKIHSMPISSFYYGDESEHADSPTRFVDQFAFVGTLDYSSLVTIPDAIKFRKEICGGEDLIIKYNLNLAQEAISYILANWPGSEVLDSSDPNDQIISAMFNIKIPNVLAHSPEELLQAATFIKDYLKDFKKTFILAFVYKGAVWTRWSAQIYLELEDFKWGLEALKEAVDEFNKQAKATKLAK